MGDTETFGPYRLDELVGRGGMGEVWRAWDTRRRRVVALKRLGPEQSGNAEFEARFRRECELAARLNAPTVIPIHDYGEIDGRLFLDMRYVPGQDLAARLAERGPMSPAAAVHVVTQLAAALDAAHAAGLVHRDVKPSNTLLAEGDFVYLVDFGIVRSMTSQTVLTATNGVVGSVGYLAPERITGEGEDARSDVYSLACLLHECLTGRRPFGGGTAAAVIAAHVQAPIPRPGDADPRLRPFDAVVAAGMAKDPGRRPPTAGAFARLAASALNRPAQPAQETLVGVPARPWGSTTPPPPEPPPPPRRNRWPWAAGAAALLVAALVAVVVIAPWRDRTPAPPVPIPPIETTVEPTAEKPLAVLAAVPLGGDPRSLVVDEREAHAVVVPRRFTDQVVSVDLASRVPGIPLTVSEAGGGIAVDGAGALWVPRCVPGGGACSLDLLEREGQVVAGTPMGRVPTNLVLDSRTGLAHVVELTNGTSSVVAVDTVAGRVVGAPIPLGKGNALLTLSPDGGLVAFADRSAQVSLVSTRENRLLGTAETGAGSTYAAFSPDGGRLYVSARDAGTVAAVDTTTLALVAPPTAVDPGLGGIAVTPDGRRVLVADSDSGTLLVLDATTLARIGDPVRLGGTPTAVVTAGDRIYVLDTMNDSLLIVG